MALVQVKQKLFNYLKTKMAMDLNSEIRHDCRLIIYLCYVLALKPPSMPIMPPSMASLQLSPILVTTTLIGAGYASN